MTKQMEQPVAGSTAAAPDARAVRLVFGGLLLTMFVAALDQTIMATALPTIAGELGGLSQLTWVVTVYVLAAAAVTPIWGKVSDQFGRRGLLREAILVFLAGSALCGLSGSMTQLIVFRAQHRWPPPAPRVARTEPPLTASTTTG